MKIVLLIALIFLCALIGLGLSKNYKDRKLFFYELSNFATFLKGDIQFSQKKLTEFIVGYIKQTKSVQLKTILENFLAVLEKTSISKAELFKNVTILNNEEMDSIYLFLNGLGKSDVLGQVEHMEKFLNVINAYEKVAKSESEKYCPLYTKLGVLMGLFLSLLFI